MKNTDFFFSSGSKESIISLPIAKKRKKKKLKTTTTTIQDTQCLYNIVLLKAVHKEIYCVLAPMYISVYHSANKNVRHHLSFVVDIFIYINCWVGETHIYRVPSGQSRVIELCCPSITARRKKKKLNLSESFFDR